MTLLTRTQLLRSPLAATDVESARPGTFDAVSLLSIYAAVLLVVPSSLYFTPLNSMGRPSLWLGLALMFWWALHQLQRSSPEADVVHQPLRIAIFALLAVALASYAVALFRGEPADQVSPASVSLANLVALAGVTLVALDGITTLERFRALVGTLIAFGTLVALLGLAQFATGRALVDSISVPGMSGSASAVLSRDAFVRAAGTAQHPLEYASVLCVCLPLAVVYALDRAVSPLRRHLAWCAVMIVGAAAAVSVSRSALAGVAVAVVIVLPALPKNLRSLFILGGIGLVAVVLVAVPGMLSTIISMFSTISGDPSALSRSNAFAAGFHYIPFAPLLGVGFGTFLPRYYIFDDEWMLLTVQLGVLGLVSFASLFGTSLYSAYSARRHAPSIPAARSYGQALIAALGGLAVLYASFDALSFAQSAGLAFLLFGLAGALRRICRHASAQQTTPGTSAAPHRDRATL